MKSGEKKQTFSVFFSKKYFLVNIIFLLMSRYIVAADSISPWKIIKKDSRTLSAELLFKKDVKSLFGFNWYSSDKGILSPILDRKILNGCLFRAMPVIVRDSCMKEITVFAESSSKKYPLNVRFDLPLDYHCYALAPQGGVSVTSTIRKQARCLGNGGKTTLLGGSRIMPDSINRPGFFGITGNTRFLESGTGLKETTACLPAVVVSRGKRILAWSAPSVSLKKGVWIVREDMRPVLLAKDGLFPQMGATGSSVFCTWRTENNIFLSISRDGGATWGEKRLVENSEGICNLSVSARGNRALIVWQTDNGISWRFIGADPGSIFSSIGRLDGDYSNPRSEILDNGGFVIVYLRRSARGREAVATFCDSSGKRTEKEKTILSTSFVKEVSLVHLNGQFQCGFIVETANGLRLAHWIPENGVYLLPKVEGKPFLVNISPWEGRICINYAVFRKGRIEIEAFLSSDSGFTWEGPVRIFSGRHLCVTGSDAVIKWERVKKGGDVFINGLKIFTIPQGIPCGQTVRSLRIGCCAPQGWLQDTAGFSGNGSVTVTALFRNSSAEEAVFGLNQAHAEGMSRECFIEKSGPDLVLLSGSEYEKNLVGRCKNEFGLNLGLANIGSVHSKPSVLNVTINGKIVLTEKIPPVESKGERQVPLKIPLPSLPGHYEISFEIKTEGDKDLTNNRIDFSFKIIPDKELVLELGEVITLLLPQQKRLNIKCSKPAFVSFKGKNNEPVDISGVLISNDKKRTVKLDRPVNLNPGNYVLLLRPEGEKADYVVALHKKNDPYEPNDVVGLAPVLVPDVKLDITLMPAGDKDYFVFSIPSAGHLSFSADNHSRDVIVSVRMRKHNWIVTDSDLPLSIFLKPGVYEVLVKEKWGKAIPESFPFFVKFFERKDSFEPNDFLQEARPFVLGTKKKINLFPPGDRDWFFLENDKNGYLSIMLDDKITDSEWISCALYDREGGPLEPAKDLPASFKIKKGKVYFCITGHNVSDRLLSLIVNFREEFDPLEPNDKKESARKLTMPADIFIALWPVNDQDWFSFDFQKRGYVRMDLPRGEVEDVKPAVSLWNGNNFSFLKRPLPTVFHVDSGITLLKICDLDQGFSETLFPVRFSFEPEIDPTEPNGLRESAALLACPSKTEFAMWPPDDIDFFKFKIASSGFLELSVEGGEGDLTLEFFFPGKKGFERLQFGRKAVVNSSEGEILVRIRSAIRVTGMERLTLKAVLHTVKDVGEPNNSIKEAKAIGMESWTVLSIFPAGDKDYFSLNVKEKGNFEIQDSRVPSGLSIYGDIFDGKGKLVVAGIKPGKKFILEKGDYFLMIYAFSGQSDSSIFSIRIKRKQ